MGPWKTEALTFPKLKNCDYRAGGGGSEQVRYPHDDIKPGRLEANDHQCFEQTKHL